MPYEINIVVKDEDLKRTTRALVHIPKLRENVKKLGNGKTKSSMSDWKQLAIIYGLAFSVSLAVFLFIEWGTRP